MKQGMAQDEDRLASLDGLPRERLPQQDLWAGIHTRIGPPQRQRGPRAWPFGAALAASVCVAVLATGLLLRPALPPAEPVPASDVVLATAASAPESGRVQTPYSNTQGSPRLSARALRTLRSESRDNAPTLVAERAEASGLMKATYGGAGRSGQGQQAILRAHLKLVAQAEREVRRALAEDPQSASLQGLLLVAQQKRTTLTNLLVHEPD